MSSNRKQLKLVALFYLIGAIASVVIGVMMLVNGGNDNPLVALGSYFVAAILLLNAVIGFVGGGLGVRAANNPAKAGATFVWGVICFALMLVIFIYTCVSTGLDLELLASTAMNGLYCYLAHAVKKEGQDRLS